MGKSWPAQVSTFDFAKSQAGRAQSNKYLIFAKNCENAMADWILLLGKAIMPDDIASLDPRIIAAFKAIHRVICGHEGTHFLRVYFHYKR